MKRLACVIAALLLASSASATTPRSLEDSPNRAAYYLCENVAAAAEGSCGTLDVGEKYSYALFEFHDTAADCTTVSITIEGRSWSSGDWIILGTLTTSDDGIIYQGLVPRQIRANATTLTDCVAADVIAEFSGTLK